MKKEHHEDCYTPDEVLATLKSDGINIPKELKSRTFKNFFGNSLSQKFNNQVVGRGNVYRLKSSPSMVSAFEKRYS